MFSENIFSYYLIDHPSSKMIEEVTEVWGKESTLQHECLY